VTNGVALQRATSGHLWACVVSMVPGAAGERQPWLLDLTALGVAPVAGTQDGPVDPPAPPGGTVDLPAVLQAIAAARGPRDGKDAEFNSVAGVKNTAEATYDRVGREADRLAATLMIVEQFAQEAADGEWWRAPAADDYGLPAELAQYLGSESERRIVRAAITMLEYICRLEEFPRRDGGTILRT
jgi:hypothetical protein